MKVSIRDTLRLQELSHRNILAYLLGQGWQVVDQMGDKAQVLSITGDNGQCWELLVPMRNTVADYVLRMADIVSTLAKFECRSELTVFEDFCLAGVDVVRIRVPHAERDGSVFIEAGVALYEHAKMLLLSAACSTLSPKPAYHAGKVVEAVAYLNSVRCGQTERGSYVIKLLSPVDPAFGNRAPQLPGLENDPFSRQVTRRLAESLHQLERAIVACETSEGFKAFEQSVHKGVSANLCEAVSGLIEYGRGTDIALTWARTRPTTEKNARIQFSEDSAGILREAAREFRKREPKIDASLTGWVVKLARDPDKNFDGDAALLVLLDGEKQRRSVRVRFEQTDYDTVIHAFKQKLLLSLEGDMHQAGQRWELKSPRSVTIAPIDE